MIQLHAFTLPDDVNKINEFLAANKPAGDIHFQQDQMLVFTKDGVVPPAYEIAQINELLVSVRSAKFQQEVALEIATLDLARYKANSPEHTKINSDIT